MILRNAYTRGQINCFIAARNQYGFNDVLDWIQSGADSTLSAEEPGRVHRLETWPQPTASALPFTTANPQPTEAPTALVLKAAGSLQDQVLVLKRP